MPLFYLRLNECGDVVDDDEGTEAADLATARELALVAARDIMSAEISKGRLCLECRIDIADQAGVVLMTLSFRDAVAVTGQWTEPATHRADA